MSKAPAMPMYWDAYLADTTHLTTEEHGAYLLLLAAMWRRNGRVPDDDKDNARILGLTPAKWRKMRVRFLETISGFEVKDGVITQEKLQKTWESTQEKIGKNRENGAKGGRPASKENNRIAKAKGYSSVNPNKSIPEPEPEPEPKNTPLPPRGSDSDLFGDKKPEKDTPLSILCEIVPEETARALVEYRKTKKKPLTLHAAKLAVTELRKFPDPVASINQTILNGWTGFFEPKGGVEPGRGDSASKWRDRIDRKYGGQP